MKLDTIALETELVEDLRRDGLDANNQVAERSASDGDGNPCRHCLEEIPGGAGMLIFAHRPFETIQPYAEVGPVFACAESCERHAPDAGLPDLYADRVMLLRGYDCQERIVYGTGRVATGSEIVSTAADIMANDRVVFVHVRSSTNNCYHFRIE